MASHKTSVRLSVPLDSAMAPLVAGFSEQAGIALGLSRMDALKLTLASEEVFGYLTQHAQQDHNLELEAAGGGYYAELRLQVPPQAMDMTVFNLTATPSLDDPESLDDLGLLIASRSVDRFTIAAGESGDMVLSFRKEKDYPPPGDEAPAPPGELARFSVGAPSPQQIKLVSRLVSRFYPAHQHPRSFTVPGKLVDMIASGEYQAVIAFDRDDQVGGCLIWRWRGDRSVQGYGPYIFDQPQAADMAQAMVDACLQKLARTDVLGLVFGPATEHLPPDYFELLGELVIHTPEGKTYQQPHYYRQLNEDPGDQIWTHPRLERFLRDQYQRLFLPRRLSTTGQEGESRPAHLVIGAKINRELHSVSLHPLWDGQDAGACLARHVKTLTGEGLPNILLFLDLGLGWSSYLVPDILDTGFSPRLVLPCSGQSDIVVFEHLGGAA